MREVTAALLAEHFRVDPATGSVKYRSRAGNWLDAGWVKPGSQSGGGGYRIVSVPIGYRKYKKLRVHHLVWAWVHGKLPTGEIDHINNDRADNRIENLREVSVSQNRTNRVNSKTRSSGYKWCTFCKKSKKWIAQVQMPDGTGPKRVWFFRQSFETAEEAYSAACNAAKTLHGEFYNAG